LKSRFRLFPAVYPRLTSGPLSGVCASANSKAKRTKFFLPTLLDFAPDGACLSGSVTAAEVGSYPAFSPFPLSGKPNNGGMFSVALSVPAPKIQVLDPGVTRHHALRSPDFPP